jgi:hypothetical protein
VLRGRNVASFKFALAKSILNLAESGRATASMEELAVPFSQDLCAHIKEVDTQSTSAGSRILDACRHFNAGRITKDELISNTALLGFNNVIDAFHVVGSGDVSTRFYRAIAGLLPGVPEQVVGGLLGGEVGRTPDTRHRSLFRHIPAISHPSFNCNCHRFRWNAELHPTGIPVSAGNQLYHGEANGPSGPHR